MKLGIVGSGKVGSALGAWAAKVGYQVAFTAKNESHARDAAQHAGHNAKALPLRELIDESELIFLTLPYSEVKKVLSRMRAHLARKIIVDVTNPITPDHKALVLGHTTSGAEEIAKLSMDISVVKAFNAVFAEVYASQDPKIAGQTISIFFAGDDADAKQKVGELIERLGFDAVDAGPLQNARYLEPLSLLNIHLGRVLGYGTRIGFGLLREDLNT
jgi:8-hydroxy-5-deazaflavin:NADPH oxidoreductase